VTRTLTRLVSFRHSFSSDWDPFPKQTKPIGPGHFTRPRRVASSVAENRGTNYFSGCRHKSREHSPSLGCLLACGLKEVHLSGAPWEVAEGGIIHRPEDIALQPLLGHFVIISQSYSDLSQTSESSLRYCHELAQISGDIPSLSYKFAVVLIPNKCNLRYF
jgi:hypothetical protein